MTIRADVRVVRNSCSVVTVKPLSWWPHCVDVAVLLLRGSGCISFAPKIVGKLNIAIKNWVLKHYNLGKPHIPLKGMRQFLSCVNIEVYHKSVMETLFHMTRHEQKQSQLIRFNEN